MNTMIFSPSKYIQGAGVFEDLSVHCQKICKSNVLILIDQYAYKDLKDIIKNQFESLSLNAILLVFQQECCMEEINKIKDMVREKRIGIIVGIGGGKVIDTAKAAAYFANLALVVVPTTASTDGPCSSLAVLYEKDGTFREYLYLTSSPNLVLVDTLLIIKAPVRLFAAGMGDALSTYFETEAFCEGELERYGKSSISITARQLSRACLETILTYGLEAKAAVEKGECQEAVDKVTEAIIYLSCIGFESGGLAAAHAIANALTYVPQGAKLLHGEKVAFGTFTQILLENIDTELIKRIQDFCQALQLPISLKDIGLNKPEDIEIVVEAVFKSEQPIHHMRSIFRDQTLLKEAMYKTNQITK